MCNANFADNFAENKEGYQLANYIFIYDAFTTLKHKLYLIPEELYLYCYLSMCKTSRSRKLNITIDFVHKNIPVKYHRSRPERNRDAIVKHLISLKNKGVVQLQISDDVLRNKIYGRCVEFEIQFSELKNKKSERIRIAKDEFFEFDNMYHFYIYAAVKRYDYVTNEDGLYGRWISLQEFADLLGVGRSTFIRYSNEMIKRGKLYKYTGMRKEQSKERDKNRYRTIPFPQEIVAKYENRYSVKSRSSVD